MISLPMAPDRALGYESADALVWLDPDPTRLATPAQAEAIVNYVRQGGHLVLAAGSEWQALSGSFLSRLLPAAPTASFLTSDVSGLQAFKPPEKIDPFPIMRMARVRGEVVAQQDGYPLIVRGTVGMGRVTLIAFDPTKSPFSEFQARERFWADVLQIEVAHRDPQAVGSLNPASATMIQALNDFPGIKPVNFRFVGLFLAFYVILIGPVDYFVLKRLKKLHWTWVTFPCVAVLFSVVAFAVMASGRVLMLAANSVCIVDAEQGGKEVSGTTFMTFLSPQQTHYRISVASPAVGVVTPLEFDFGGLMRGGGPSLSASNCSVIAPGERGQIIDGLLVRVWDAQTVQSFWRAPSGDLPEVKVSLDSSAQYHIVVDNKSSDALTDAVLVVRGGVLQLGTIAAKQTRDQGGMAPMPLPAYVHSLRSGAQAPNYGGGPYPYQNRVLSRERAGGQARWVSLFGAGADAPAQPVFTRWIQHNQPDNGNGRFNQIDSSAYDLPARLQLPALGKDDAILLYNTPRAFAQIELEGHSPNSWNVTLVRLRVPVSAAPQP
jgi:hypothetical protein